MKKLTLIVLTVLFLIGIGSIATTPLTLEMFGVKSSIFKTVARYAAEREYVVNNQYNRYGFYDLVFGGYIDYNINNFDDSTHKHQNILNGAKALFNNGVIIKAAYKAVKKNIVEAACDFDIIEVALADLDQFEKNVKGDFDENFFNELKMGRVVLDSLRHVPWKNQGDNHYAMEDSAQARVLNLVKASGFNRADYEIAVKYPHLKEATLWCIADLRKTLHKKI